MENIQVLDSEFDSLNKRELAELIKIVDDNFINPIKDRGYFEGYEKLSEKFLDKGRAIFLRNQEEVLIAVSVFYANPKHFKYAYIPFTGILPEYQNMGLGKIIISYRNSLIAKIGMKGIKSSCSANNKSMISVLNKSGYERIKDPKKIAEWKNENPKDNWDKAFFVLEF